MWSYNPYLKRWFHASGATSDNGPDERPGEIDVEQSPRPAAGVEPAPNLSNCNCGGNGMRKVR